MGEWKTRRKSSAPHMPLKSPSRKTKHVVIFSQLAGHRSSHQLAGHRFAPFVNEATLMIPENNPSFSFDITSNALLWMQYTCT
jgi:hypothetical protein